MALDGYRHAIFPTYSPPKIKFVEGRGAWLRAADGREYLDFIAGIAVNALGHCHPKLVEALNEQASKLWHLSNMFDVPGQEELAEIYCKHTFADAVFFTNSGAEAVECALKSARRYHYANGAPERVDIIGFEGAFHGRTYATINAAGNPKYVEGFGPRLPAYKQCKFGDLGALAAMMGPETAAVIIEPVQGEGGLRALPVEMLTAMRKLCTERGALLIYDEVQCGAGRTGKLFAHQWADNAEPDIMALAKGIGGGFPLGMCLATRAVSQTMVVGTHGTTYGGNALAVAVGRAVINEMLAPGFMDRVNTAAGKLREGLEQIASQQPDKVIEVRGKGLLTGIRVKVPNTAVRDAARDRGLLVGVAGADVVRMAPPLIVSDKEIARALDTLNEAVAATDLPPAKA